MAIKLADTARPNNYIDAEHPGTFPVAYAEDVWFADGTRLSEKTFSGDSIQKEELPLVSSAQLGKIYQYIGESGTYEHGCFYECVENDGDYEWKELPVVKNAVVYTDTEPTIGAYAEGSIIVYSGETVNGYKKGHHYKYVVDESHTLNLFIGENATIQATTYLRVLEDELIVGAHTYNESGDNSGYIISVNENTIEYYSYYYKQIMTVVNIQQGASSTINITDYIDIGGGNDEKAVGGIIDVETLPTSNIKNTFYRVVGSNEYHAGDETNQTTERIATYEDIQKEFIGTQAEWDILTTAEKKTYTIVNITDDESDASAVVNTVTDGDMHAVTSNAVYDELKKVQSQTYECFGFLINSDPDTITGYGHATVTLKNGIAEIRFSARIQTNSMTSNFNWGLNRDLLSHLIPDLPYIVPVSANSNLIFFTPSGTVLIDNMGYSAMGAATNQFWTPARMYQIDGTIGSWSSDQFPVNSYITGTVYGVYTV